MTSVNFYMVI